MPHEPSDGKVRCQKHDVRSRSTPWTIPDRCCTLPWAYVNQGGVLREQGFTPIGHLALPHFSSWRICQQCRRIVWPSCYCYCSLLSVVCCFCCVFLLLLLLLLLLLCSSFFGSFLFLSFDWAKHQLRSVSAPTQLLLRKHSLLHFEAFPIEKHHICNVFCSFGAALYASLLSFLRASLLSRSAISFFNLFQNLTKFKAVFLAKFADLHRTVTRLFRSSSAKRNAVTKWEHYLCKNIENMFQLLKTSVSTRVWIMPCFLSHSRWSQIENIFIFECIFTSHRYIMDVHLYIYIYIYIHLYIYFFVWHIQINGEVGGLKALPTRSINFFGVTGAWTSTLVAFPPVQSSIRFWHCYWNFGRRFPLTARSSSQSVGGDSVWEQVDSESGKLFEFFQLSVLLCVPWLWKVVWSTWSWS